MTAELRAAAIRLLSELVAFPTVTTESNLELIDHVEEALVAAGAVTVRTYDDARRKANLLATIGPERPGGVVLSGHTDVVPAGEAGWTTPPFVASLRDDRVHGRGTADMKGFLACLVAMAPRFAAGPLSVPVHLAFTYDEEVGCRGAPALIERLLADGHRPRAAIVGEPTSMGVVLGHKGCYEYTTTITGVEGHGSTPDAGANAVEWGARYVTRLLELRRELEGRGAPTGEGYDPPGTTLNVGVMRGGTARNVIAGTCTIEWELRSVEPSDAEFVLAAIGGFEDEIREGCPRVTVGRTAAGEVGGLVPSDDSPALALVRRVLADPPVGLVSFGTEAGLYQEAGIPAVVCGPGSIGVAHQPDEHIEVEQLDRCLEMLLRLTDVLATPGW